MTAASLTLRATPALPPWTAVAALAVAAGLWAVWIGTPAFPLDDGYITANNARALLAGADPNYGVSPLTGATSPVHLALVALAALFAGPLWGNALVGWAAWLAYALAVLRIGRLAGFAGAPAVAFAVSGLIAGRTAVHMLNGLETGLAMAAVAWALILAETGRWRALAPLLGVLPFLRPELGALSVALFAWRAWTLGRTGWRETARATALAALAALPFAAWVLIETGRLLPDTIAAKRAFFAEGTLPLADKIELTIVALGLMALQIGPLALGAADLGRRGAVRAAALGCGAIVLAFAWIGPGVLQHNGCRYLYPMVPVLLLALARGIEAARSPRAGLLLALAAGWAVAHMALSLGGYRAALDHYRVDAERAASWLRAHVPADAPVLIHDAGYVAHATRARLVDLVGLKTPASVAVHRALTQPSGGAQRGAAIARIAREAGARYAVILDNWDENFAIADGLRAGGFALEPVSPGPYTVYRLARPAPE